jgi:hypothetical protein
VAFVHGKVAYLMVNTKDISAFCDSISMSVSVATGDTTTFGSAWASALAGIASGSFSVSGKYDPTATSGPADVFENCITGGVAVAVVHRPGGTGTPQRNNACNAIVTGYSESSPVGDIVTFSAELQMTGALTSTNQ